jgi:hypothetical protein
MNLMKMEANCQIRQGSVRMRRRRIMNQSVGMMKEFWTVSFLGN